MGMYHSLFSLLISIWIVCKWKKIQWIALCMLVSLFSQTIVNINFFFFLYSVFKKKVMVVTHLYSFLAVPHGLLDLSSLIRDWTGPQQWKLWNLSTRLLGNSLLICNLYYLSCMILVSIFKVWKVLFLIKILKYQTFLVNIRNNYKKQMVSNFVI